MKRRRVPSSFLLVGLLAVAVPVARASITSVWEVESYKEFDEGEGKAALITSLGQVKPGWQTTSTALDFGSAWSTLQGPDGTIYFGTDKEAGIYKLVGKKLSRLAGIKKAVAVVSLALVNGNLYAGTMPGGQIWEVETRSGKHRQVATIKDAETVWALAPSNDGKQLYAGTGPNGKLVRMEIGSGHKVSEVFATGDKRVMSVSVSKDGAVWFGTSEKGVLYRHDPAQKSTRAMADFAGNEVTAITPHKDGVVVAANDLKEPSTGAEKTARAVGQAEKKADAGQKLDKEEGGPEEAAPTGVETPRKGGRKGSGAIFWVRDNGQLRQLHALTQTYFTSVISVGEGQVFAGAADKGRIYMIDTDGSVSTAIDVEERRVDSLMPSRDGVVFATSDGAALYRAVGEASKSTYTSKVFDAQVPAQFGRLVWWGKGEFAVQTRSGFTGEPDQGWSDWQGPKDVSKAGGGGTRGSVISPPGRYFQYRVQFKKNEDALQQTTLYYLPQNLPTRVKEIKVGEERTRGKLSTLDAAPTKTKTPLVKVSWTVDNDDGDETIYSLAVRQEGDVRWRNLETGKQLTATEYSWNTETFPDGYYRLRVSASDRQANSAERSRDHYLVTPIFLIDNQRPAIKELEVRYPKGSATAVDGMSSISEMAYSIDEGAWMVGGTEDGLFDELSEKLRLDLPKDLGAGLHTLAVRVADEAGNIAAASVNFRIK